MQLTLTHLFRPKWQHPRSDVRKRAVGNLDPRQEQDQSILETIARQDRDTEVRCQALKKLNQLDCLQELAGRDGDRQVQQGALNRLCELATGDTDAELPLARRLALLDQLEQADYLLHVALRGDCFEIRQEAVLRLQDEAALGQIVRTSDHHELRQLAAEAIRDPQQLQELIRSCRQRDKGVYRILKHTQERQRQQAQQAEQHRQAQEQLCAALEKLAEEGVANHYRAKLQALSQQWEALEGPLEAGFETRYQKAQAQCALKAERYAEELAERERQQQLLAERAQLPDRLDQLIKQLHDNAPAIDTGASQLEQLHARWQSLAAQAPVATAEQRRWEQRIEQAERLLHAWQRLQQLEPALRALDDNADPAELLSQLDWPAELPQPTVVKQLRHRPAPKKSDREDGAQQEQQRQQQAQFAALEQALEQGQLSQAAELIRPLRDQERTLSRDQRAQLKRLNAAYRDLSGWHNFATRPKLEQLCAAMEALAAESELGDAQRAARLRELQQQWKELDSPQIPHALRQRFQHANDRAYQACRDHFEQQRQQRQQNLVQRERLCDQLDTLLEQWQQAPGDVRLLTRHNRELRADWRRFSPVERGPGKKLQRRFNRGLKTLDALIDQARTDNGVQKQALLDQLVELCEQSDRQDVSEQVRDLQQQWKQLGPTERELEARLWEAFSGHCNTLFAQVRAARADSEAQARSAASELCDQLDNATQALAQSPARLQQQFDEQASQLTDSRRLQQRFERALVAYQLRLHPEEADWEPLNRVESLCRHLEKPLLDGEQPDRSVLEQVAAQLHEIKEPACTALRKRCEQLNQLADGTLDLDTVVATSSDALRLLCVRLEILRGEASPESDQALRMEYQMSRLQDALQDGNDAPCFRSMMELQREWLTVPFNSYFDELNERFQRQLTNDCAG